MSKVVQVSDLWAIWSGINRQDTDVYFAADDEIFHPVSVLMVVDWQYLSVIFLFFSNKPGVLLLTLLFW